MTVSNWSEAPTDLLWKIIERLSLADYIRFGGVCVSWRAVLAEKRLPRPPLHQLPWLLLPEISDSGTNSPVRTFSLTDDKEHYLDMPPYLRRLTCIGSSQGWLLFVDLHSIVSEISMFDPISQNRATLPSIASLPTAIHPCRDYYDPHMFMKVVVSPCRSSGFTASAIRMRAGSLAVAREGDKSWTTIDFTPGLHRFCDIILHKEQLWGVTSDGRVVACDISDVYHPRIMFTVRAPRSKEFNDSRNRIYLVECAGDILLVWRGLREVTEWTVLQVWRGPNEEIHKEVETIAVKIFKLDQSDGQVKWVELKRLTSHSLFLGNHLSIAVSFQDFPELTSNCLYFTNISPLRHSGSDLLIYHMEDKSLEPLLSLGMSKMKRPQMFWFTPNLSIGQPVRTMVLDSRRVLRSLVQKLRESKSDYQTGKDGILTLPNQ